MVLLPDDVWANDLEPGTYFSKACDWNVYRGDISICTDLLIKRQRMVDDDPSMSSTCYVIRSDAQCKRRVSSSTTLRYMDWNRFHASASIALLRTLLVCINIIFVLSGGILFLLGIVLRGQLSTLLDITPEMSSSAPYILVGLGLIIFFIGLFSFWCTLKGHIALLYIYSTVVFLIFVAEILLAATVLMKQQTYEETFKTSLSNVMRQYPSEPTAPHVDRLQSALSCCGVDSYVDWFQTPYGQTLLQVPASCCKKTLNHTCSRTDLKKEYLPADINADGCYATVISVIKSNYPVFGGIIIAIALFPLIGVILACCLAQQMRKQRYEQVA